MSNQSNNQGRAYEYICLTILHDEISKFRNVEIVHNSAYIAASHAWELIDKMLQNTLTISATSIVATIFEMEPLIIENNNDILKLFLQTDKEGKEGDVRDIIIQRKDIQWEIGLSIKHNHTALKHCRLAKSLDFGNSWFSIPCSKQYWDNITPVFDYLQKQKNLDKSWKDLPNKMNEIYKPLLQAFITEVDFMNRTNNAFPQKLSKYLLGLFDFYKIISIDKKQLTQIQTFNLNGELNKPSKVQKSSIEVPLVKLPNRIVQLSFKPNSSNTIELYMNEGWQFSFRLHSAKTKIETSLKFDVQAVGMPPTVLTLECKWRKID